jgi:carboxyl-terminal processing protease
MQKIANFMMSKKFIPVILVLVGASFFIAFQSQGRNDNDNPKSKYAKVLRNVGELLEQGHYSPKKIDDAFSKSVLNKFIADLDNDKNILLQTDIDSFKVFETKIDDEIHGKEIQSFFKINDVYNQRLNETINLFKELFEKPFEFTKDENIVIDPDKLSYPKTIAERKELWRKRFKYLALEKFVGLQEEREKNKDKKGYLNKADSTLEREARESLKKQITRFFTTKKTRETTDQNFSTFVNAITGVMDPHTDYMPPIDVRSFNESMSGSFYGIGAQLKEDDGKIKIASLISGGPAWKGGELKIEDEVIKIAQGNAEPVDVTGYSVQDAVKLIRGAQAKTEVKLTVKRFDGSTKVITIIRDEIKLDDTFARSAIINGEKKIGYIYLPEFYINFEKADGSRCSDDVAKEIEKLKAEKVDGIIMDLRGNGGGSLPEVVKMVGLFIEEGPICQVKGREDKPYQWRDKDKSILYNGPLTVMVDEFSASASEIFAAAIQDYKRGIIIGSSSTYGKGTVQRNIPLNPDAENPAFANKQIEDLGGVKLTLQKFYRVNGGATQLKGVTPDIVLPDRRDYLKMREKDNPNALVWDEISKSDYKPWESNMNSFAVAADEQARLSTNSRFNDIKTNLQLLEKYNNKPISLNIKQYKEEQKQFKATYKQLEELFKLPKALVVKNIVADTTKFNATKDKADKNNAFLKSIGNDIYIDETVKVMNNMITQNATAKKD